MNARQLQTWTEWLKRHPAKRLGAAVAITTAAFCAAAAPHVAAAADNDASSALSTAGARIRDAAITTKAKAALVGTDNLSSGDIHVKTRRGNVVLTGSVPDLQQRKLAVDTVKQVEGVKDVHDQLTIRPK